ncbi:unnamed protein product, partial [Brachionus calyciflorus]
SDTFSTKLESVNRQLPDLTNITLILKSIKSKASGSKSSG